MEFTLKYLDHFFGYMALVWPLLALLALTVVLMGLVVGRLETWSRFDAVYWAFITATTVGYGDFRPLRRFSRIISILIAFVGVILTGILIALAVNAASLSLKDSSF
jgi:voltage-gated potassium channel